MKFSSLMTTSRETSPDTRKKTESAGKFFGRLPLMLLCCIVCIRLFPVIAYYGSGSASALRGGCMDSILYLNGAQSLLSDAVGILGPQPLSVFPPLNFLYIAFFLLIGNGHILAAALGMFLTGILTVLAVYVLAAELFGNRVALVAAVITGLYPNLVFFSMTFYSENLAMLLFVAAFWAIVKYRHTRHTGFLFMAGLLWAAFSFTRGGVHYFAVLIGAYLAVIRFRDGLGAAVRPFAAFVLTTYLTMFMLNAALFPLKGDFALDSKNGVATALHGTNRIFNPCTDYGNLETIFFLANEIGESWPEGTLIYNDSYAKMPSWKVYLEIANYIAEEPITYVKMCFERLSFSWSPNQYVIYFLKFKLRDFDQNLVGGLCNLIALSCLLIVSCAVLGLFISKDCLRAPFIIYVLFSCLLVCLTAGNTRYRLPLMPFFAIYCAYFIVSVRKAVISQVKPIPVICLLGLLALLWANGVYRYVEDFRFSYNDYTLRLIERSLQEGFPKTAKLYIDQAAFMRYNTSQEEQLQKYRKAVSGILAKEQL